MKNVLRPRKARQSATLRDHLGCTETAVIELQTGALNRSAIYPELDRELDQNRRGEPMKIMKGVGSAPKLAPDGLAQGRIGRDEASRL